VQFDSEQSISIGCIHPQAPTPTPPQSGREAGLGDGWAGEAPPVDIRTHDVTSHSLGMVVYRDGALHNSRIIGRNSRIPCERTRDDYVTTHDGQTTLDLWLVQGEQPDPIACQVLGHIEFYGITARPAGQSRLSVTFRYNANGVVELEAMDLDSGQTLAHRVVSESITLEDVTRNRAPMNIVMLIDCSGSMYGQSMDDARAAAWTFAEKSLASNRQIAVVAFPGGVICPLTTDGRKIEEALLALSPVGSTPLAEGLAAARELTRTKAGVQKVFVVLTDGHPDDPDSATTEATRIRTSGGRLVTIGVGPQVRPEFLRLLASRPEDYHFCNESVELQGTFVNLATELGGE
jgi:Mg-chelatase subunit ChlD